MELEEYNLGDITLVLSGSIIPLRNRSELEQQALGNELAAIVSSKLNQELADYGGLFSVHVVSVNKGCIKVKLAITWKKLNDFARENFAFPAMILSLVSCLSLSYPVHQQPFPAKSTPIKCNIQRGEFRLAKNAVYVEEGQSLSGALKNIERIGFSSNQLYVAVFQYNPQCFPTGSIHQIRSNSVLVVPDDKIIKAIPQSYADGIVARR